jgi:hypothetical protein
MIRYTFLSKKIMKRKSSVLLLGAAIFMASCTNKSIPTNGENDDMYATSADAAQAPLVASTNTPFNKNNGVNTQQLPYEDEYDRLDNGEVLQSTDEYYSEDYITTRDYKRKLSSKPGYSDGYSEGYSQGWLDNSWSQPISMGWNSPFNRFGFNSFSPFNSGVFMSYGFGGGWNSWNRFSPWGFNSWNNPWMMDSWAFNSWGYNPWGFNSFYSPWGFNSFNSPWGFNNFNNPYDFYGNGFNNYRPFYGNQAVVAQNAYRNGSRTYGARETGRNSSNYNDRFVNTNKPAASASSGRTSSSVRNSGNTSTANGERVLADRKNGTWVGNPSSNTNSSNRTTYSNSRTSSGSTDSYNPSTRRPASYDSYNRSTNSGSSSYSSRSASNNNTAQGNTYTRPSSSRSSGNNYSSPSYDRGSSSYSSPSSSNSSYSSGSSSRGSSSSSSSSGGSSSGGGSSRGPR